MAGLYVMNEPPLRLIHGIKHFTRARLVHTKYIEKDLHSSANISELKTVEEEKQS